MLRWAPRMSPCLLPSFPDGQVTAQGTSKQDPFLPGTLLQAPTCAPCRWPTSGAQASPRPGLGSLGRHRDRGNSHITTGGALRLPETPGAWRIPKEAAPPAGGSQHRPPSPLALKRGGYLLTTESIRCPWGHRVSVGWTCLQIRPPKKMPITPKFRSWTYILRNSDRGSVGRLGPGSSALHGQGRGAVLPQTPRTGSGTNLKT